MSVIWGRSRDSVDKFREKFSSGKLGGLDDLSSWFCLELRDRNMGFISERSCRDGWQDLSEVIDRMTENSSVGSETRPGARTVLTYV